ncbi:MAG: alpha-amylase [Desulfobacteraceae bacterium]|jgi:alpha-amylase
MPDNGTMMQYFHWYYQSTDAAPDLWEQVTRQSVDLSELGISALWLPPPYKGAAGRHDVGYGIYDLYDLGEFHQKGSVRTKYGTRQQYLKAIKSAHLAGMQVYADVVLNHKAGADDTQWVKASRVHYDNRNFHYGDETWIEAWTHFYFPGRGDKYSDFKWHYHHFDGVDWAHNLGEKAIFKFLGLGKDWEKMVSGEHGNYDYLMFSDLDMNHPEVRTELARWAKWFIRTTDVDGFRLDAIKHIQYSFFRDWLSFLRRDLDPKEIFAVGEYWSSQVGELIHYLDKTDGLMSLFDAPLQNNFYLASRAPGGHYDMRRLLDNTLVAADPVHAVTLVDNHDTQPCQALERWVDWWFKPLAYAVILLRQDGYPCVFYPDYYGAEYNDCGQHITLAPVPGLHEMIHARKHLAYGQQRDYFDHPDLIGWTRQGDGEHPGSGLAVLMSNGPGGRKWMNVGDAHAGKTFSDTLGNLPGTVIINEHGWGEFMTRGGSVSVWAPSGQ